MNPVFVHSGVTSYCGDNREILRALPEKSVNTCVTSPPYFGLRNYGCAAQIGLEPTTAEYVGALVDVFREVWRVLRDDGTLWLNVGDSYAGSGKGNTYGMKPKDLMMIPARVAIALQDDGWYLRSDIIWDKPNSMPESVTDRPTKAHEYIFLLTKSQKYYYDADAIKERAAPSSNTLRQSNARRKRDSFKRNGSKRSVAHHGQTMGTHRANRNESSYDIETRNKRSVWRVATLPCSESHFATFPPELIRPCVLAGAPVGGVVLDPFGGSGTTALVARQEQRRTILCELNPKYIEIQERRLNVAQTTMFDALQQGHL